MEQTSVEKKEYPVIEKQAMAAGIPFKVLKSEPRVSWRSNYAYYLKQKAENTPLRPMFGKKLPDGTFQVYINGAWVTKDLWKDYTVDKVDATGKVVVNAKTGKPTKQLLFDEKFDYLVEFEAPVPVEYWNKDSNARVTEQTTTAWVRCSKSLGAKIAEQIDDPRVDTSKNYFMINYDSTKAPAEQYKVKFVR